MLAAWLGWLGTAGTFAAYILLWRGRLGPNSRKYAALNVVGGCMAGLASAHYGAWASAASNFVWAVVGLQSIVETTRATAAIRAMQNRPLLVEPLEEGEELTPEPAAA